MRGSGYCNTTTFYNLFFWSEVVYKIILFYLDGASRYTEGFLLTRICGKAHQCHSTTEMDIYSMH